MAAMTEGEGHRDAASEWSSVACGSLEEPLSELMYTFMIKIMKQSAGKMLNSNLGKVIKSTECLNANTVNGKARCPISPRWHCPVKFIVWAEAHVLAPYHTWTLTVIWIPRSCSQSLETLSDTHLRHTVTVVNNASSYLRFMNYTAPHVDNCSQQAYIYSCPYSWTTSFFFSPSNLCD